MVHLDPQSVLDVGPGLGKCKFVCREYPDYRKDRRDGYAGLRRG
jgi:hypothetical protein